MEASCPSSIEQIPNSHLKTLFEKAFEEKSLTTDYLGADGKPKKMRLSRDLVKYIWQYMSDMIHVVNYGFNSHDKRKGLIFELMMTEVVREMYKGQPNFLVLHAPAPLDFSQRQGEGIDIVGGFRQNGFVVPYFLINTKLHYELNGHAERHPLLGVPISILEGNQVFEDSEALTSRFIKDPFPQHFARDIARAYGQKIHQSLKFRS